MSDEVELGVTIIGSSEWREVLTDGGNEPELEGNEGLCHNKTQRILVNRDEVAPAGIPSVRFHEQFHAAVRISGAALGLKRIIGCSDEKMEEIEEYIVSAWGQAMFDVLYRNNYLKY